MNGLFGARSRFLSVATAGKTVGASRILYNNIRPISVRKIHSSVYAFNEKKEQPSKNVSLFGDITDASTPSHLDNVVDYANTLSGGEEDTSLLSEEEQAKRRVEELKKTLTPEKDTTLQTYYKETYKPLIAIDELLSPLKKQVYLANVTKNGFFKNGETVKLDNNKEYQLTLKKQEIEVLEPSIYLKSYRIKSSTKKVTLVTRLLNQLPLKEAINQCHFSTKKVAKDVGEMLEGAIEKAEQINLDANKLYISQIWSGSDGEDRRRLDFKGRGRLGIIKHRHAHVRVILKSEQTKKRLVYEKSLKALKKKAWEQLPNEVIRGVAPGYYKW